jgi:large subunit ribosomal protein L15
MKTHKRKKSSRLRGSRTAGYGFRQKHKGHGNKGGFGMAGAGKRADHKKQYAKNLDKKKGQYFGKQGFTSRGTAKKKYDKINLSDIKANFFKKNGDKIDLSGYKILGDGEGFKAEIMAKSASASAIEKMQKAGGRLILTEKKEDFEEVIEESEEEEKTEKIEKKNAKEKMSEKKTLDKKDKEVKTKKKEEKKKVSDVKTEKKKEVKKK